MNTKLILGLLVILTAGVGLLASTTLLEAIGTAHAQEGVAQQKNFGQCKQEKNRNACENVVK
jgi:hypothetical protein